jgi:hypothetical protein
VQVVGAVSAMQAARHDTPIVQALLPPALAKNARTGHPFPDRERKSENVGHPPIEMPGNFAGHLSSLAAAYCEPAARIGVVVFVTKLATAVAGLMAYSFPSEVNPYSVPPTNVEPAKAFTPEPLMVT